MVGGVVSAVGVFVGTSGWFSWGLLVQAGGCGGRRRVPGVMVIS